MSTRRSAPEELATSGAAAGLLLAWTAAGLVADPLRRRLRRPSTADLRAAVRDRRILLTGASSGIGEMTALRLSEAGAKVFIVSRREEQLGRVAAEMAAAGGRPYVYRADLTDAEDLAGVLEAIDAEHGGVDILINNAGRSIRRSVAGSAGRTHDFERTMDINYFAPLHLIMGVLPGMRERGHGHIINVLSMGVQIHAPRFGAYLASKAALEAVSDCAAVETLLDGIDWTTVYMPLVRTPMIAPTKAYDAYPALSVAAAADMLGDAIVRRPRRVGTAVGDIAEAVRLLSPRVIERALLQEYLLFRGPDEDRDPRVDVPITTRVLRGALRTLGPLAAATRR